MIEYWTKHILDWIDNRNATLALFDNNFIMLFVMLFLDSNANLTAAMLEKTFLDGQPLSKIPMQIYENTY